MTHALYLLSVWLHILAATVWVGGMLFLVLVIVPWMRSGAREDAARMLRETGERFRNVGWSCFGVVVVTGTYNLWIRGVRLSDLGDGEWWSSPLGEAIFLKLLVFGLVLIISAIHDFVVGPRATVEIAADPQSAAAQAHRKRASMLGRLNVLLALILVGLGVVIVRGTPW